MFEVIILDRKCPWCDMAKALLKQKGIEFRESVLDTAAKKFAFKEAGFTTVPQVYHNGNLIGGYNKLVEYLEDKKSPS